MTGTAFGYNDNITTTQSTQVDSVSGATFSSKGLKAAVEHALEKAQLIP